mgnify:CR=1 FL=1
MFNETMSNETIRENLRLKIINFSRKNFKKIIILIIILFIFLCAFLFYNKLQEKNNIKIAEQYSQAALLVKQKKLFETKLLLENIINKSHQFYSPLALYLVIDNNIEKDSKKIIAYFDKILKNNKISKENLNLIKIKKAMYLIRLDKEELIVETLNPIINSNSIWKNMAINLMIEYFLSKGQNFKAQEYIKISNTKAKR